MGVFVFILFVYFVVMVGTMVSELIAIEEKLTTLINQTKNNDNEEEKNA